MNGQGSFYLKFIRNKGKSKKLIEEQKYRCVEATSPPPTFANFGHIITSVPKRNKHIKLFVGHLKKFPLLQN